MLILSIWIFILSAFKVFKGIFLYILLLEIMVELSMYHDVINDLNPDDYTMDEIKKQMAIYNRLYYLKLKQQEGWIENKRESQKGLPPKGNSASDKRRQHKG